MTSELVTAGIDVGASAVKVAVMLSPAGSGRERVGARLAGCHVERLRRRDPRAVIEFAYREALSASGAREDDVAYVATTGEGELVPNRTGHFYGMTAHARGAHFLMSGCRAVLDIGALHGRGIRMDDRSRVLDYRMTSQCASGSGQFLENIVRYLGVTLDEIGALSLSATQPERVSGICAVLAETDVINMVSRGIGVPNILRGIHESMAGRFAKLLVGMKISGAPAADAVAVTGGLAADPGLVGCLQAALAPAGLGPRVLTSPHSVLAGAIGAALWGAYRSEVMPAREAAEEPVQPLVSLPLGLPRPAGRIGR